MILTKPEIEKAIAQKQVVIEPYDPVAVGPASVDLTLHHEIRVFTPGQIIDEEADYHKITKVIDITKGYHLKPGELILGITTEKISLPANICAWLNSRSRYARIGLMSHITAPFIAPGVSNKQVLEIYNAGCNTILLKPGTKICHLILQQCKGEATYKGRWSNQEL